MEREKKATGRAKDADGRAPSLQAEKKATGRAKAAEEKAAREAQEKKRVAQAKKRNKLVQGGKLGRPRKLTPEQLRRGVEEYFASISYQEPVTREEDIVLSVDKKTGGVTFLLDDKGHRVKRIVPVLNAAGKPLTRTVYTEAPGDFGLCNFLKISRDTWERYGRAVELLEARREQATGDQAIGTRHQATVDGGDGFFDSGFASAQNDGTGDGGAQCAPLQETGRQQARTAPGPRWGPAGSAGGVSGPMWASAPTEAQAMPLGGFAGAAGGERGSPLRAEEDPEMQEARDYAEIYTLARGRVCAYLESAAETRGGRGAQFKLERIYGLTEKKDVHVDAGGSIEAFLRSLDEDG